MAISTIREKKKDLEEIEPHLRELRRISREAKSDNLDESIRKTEDEIKVAGKAAVRRAKEAQKKKSRALLNGNVDKFVNESSRMKDSIVNGDVDSFAEDVAPASRAVKATVRGIDKLERQKKARVALKRKEMRRRIRENQPNKSTLLSTKQGTEADSKIQRELRKAALKQADGNAKKAEEIIASRTKGGEDYAKIKDSFDAKLKAELTKTGSSEAEIDQIMGQGPKLARTIRAESKAKRAELVKAVDPEEVEVRYNNLIETGEGEGEGSMGLAMYGENFDVVNDLIKDGDFSESDAKKVAKLFGAEGSKMSEPSYDPETGEFSAVMTGENGEPQNITVTLADQQAYTKASAEFRTRGETRESARQKVEDALDITNSSEQSDINLINAREKSAITVDLAKKATTSKENKRKEKAASVETLRRERVKSEVAATIASTEAIAQDISEGVDAQRNNIKLAKKDAEVSESISKYDELIALEPENASYKNTLRKLKTLESMIGRRIEDNRLEQKQAERTELKESMKNSTNKS